MTRRPTVGLLVSVRDECEAEAALAGGATWIDLKEPTRGALGFVDADVARRVVDVVDGRAPVSAAAGELQQWSTSAARELLSVSGISHLKLGLAGCDCTDWAPVWRAATSEMQAHGKAVVAVIYGDAKWADSPCGEEILSVASSVPCQWALWDTFDKARGGPLVNALPAEELARQLQLARQMGMRCVLAGSLNVPRICKLPQGSADMIAVRGAACEGSRESTVSVERVAHLREAIDAWAQNAPPAFSAKNS